MPRANRLLSTPLARLGICVTLAVLTFRGLTILALDAAQIVLFGFGPQVRDFTQDWLLAKAIAAGVDPNLNMVIIAQRLELAGSWPVLLDHATPHPPTLGLLLLPFALLDYLPAALLWLGISLAALGISLVLLGRLAGVTLRLAPVIALSLALICWGPVDMDLRIGQTSILLLALLSAMFLALRAGRDLPAGLLLGLTLLIKPFVWPLALLLFLHRKWRPVLACLLVVAAGYGLAALVIGPGALVRYFTETGPGVASYYRNHWLSISLSSLAWRLFEGTWPIAWVAGQRVMYPPLVAAPSAARLLSLALPVLALAAGLWRVRRLPLEVGLGALLPVCVLISPLAWLHYLVLCLIPLAGYPRRPFPILAVAVLFLTTSQETWLQLSAQLGRPGILSWVPAVAAVAIFLAASAPEQAHTAQCSRGPIPAG